MSKTIVFITGGNNGLGYYATQQLAATGRYHVLMGSRSLSKAEAAIQSLARDQSFKVDTADIEPVQIDVTSDESIFNAASSVEKKHGHIDILMVNAGVAQAQAPDANGTGPSLRELYKNHYDTNLFGAAVTVEAFLPLLRNSTAPGGKRIAFTSSDLSSLKIAREDEGLYSAKNFPLYRSSKTALNMLMLHYHKLLASEGFTVAASNPGYCATDLNGKRGAKDPREGAKVLIEAAVGQKEKIGGWLVDEKGVMPW